jgi:hypothetical protein
MRSATGNWRRPGNSGRFVGRSPREEEAEEADKPIFGSRWSL